MADRGYTSFGSQIVLEPKSLRVSNSDKNVSNFDTKCRNIKVKLKYFTIKADSANSKKNVSNDHFHDSLSFDLLASDGRLFVTKANSCESFHSCHSNTSNKDLHEKRNGEADIGEHNRSKSSDEEFIDQITMVNAIFFNKTANGRSGDDSSINKKSNTNNEILLKTKSFEVLDTVINGEKLSLKTDQSSGDRTSAEACLNCKCSSNQNHEEKIEKLQEEEEKHHKNIVTGRCVSSYSKIGAGNSAIKTFKINRKSIHGTKKPFISKIVRRKEHQSLRNKLQPIERCEATCSEIQKQSDESVHSPEDDEQHNTVLLLCKQGIHQALEIHYLEPTQWTNHSVGFSTRHSNKDLTNAFSCVSEERIQNPKCEIVNSEVDFQESLLQLLSNVISSETSIQLFEGSTNTGINPEICCKTSQREIQQDIDQNSDLKTAITKNEIPLPNTSCEQKNVTVLYESKENCSDCPLNEFRQDLEKTGNEYQKSETTVKTDRRDKRNVTEVNEGKILNGLKNIEIESENSTVTITHTSPTKRKRSSSRKSSLPVIEESLEPVQETSNMDVLENDYCLVDTVGRPIHLFDHRGMPLTDGSGRPLRSAEGELFLKCDCNGIPVVDEETRVFDMLGRQPREEGFQPWNSPSNSRSKRLSLEDGSPLVLFDIDGRPLTSISGTMLVDTFGRSLLKLRDLLF